MKKSSEMHSVNSDTDTASDYVTNKKSTSKSDIEENNTATAAATTKYLEEEPITNTKSRKSRARTMSGKFGKMRDLVSDLTLTRRGRKDKKPPRQNIKIEVISSAPMALDVPDSSSTRTSKDSNYCSSFLSTSPEMSNSVSDPDSKRSTRDSTSLGSNRSTRDSTVLDPVRSEDTVSQNLKKKTRNF